MIRVRHVLMSILVVSLLAACGTPTGSGPSETSAPTTSTTQAPATSTTLSPVISVGDLQIIVLPDESGDLPRSLIVECPSGPRFALGALDDIQPLDTDDPGGVAVAIQPFLDNEEGQNWPQDGWKILNQSEGEILLVNKDNRESLAFMTLDKADGTWMWNGASLNPPCPLQFAVTEGLNTVEWRVDSSASPPGPEDSAISVLLTERECVSGQEIGDRLLGPQIVMTETSVRIAFAAEPPEGSFFDCQGNPETPFTVELPEPIGDREIIEGYGIGIELEDHLD